MTSNLPIDGRRRVVALAVRPEVDGGRYPVKRVVRDVLEVEADVATDGHDVIAAVHVFALRRFVRTENEYFL